MQHSLDQDSGCPPGFAARVRYFVCPFLMTVTPIAVLAAAVLHDIARGAA